MPTQAHQQEYAIADFWRTGWMRVARRFEANQLQSKAERIEARAKNASWRIKRVMNAHDAL